VFVVVLTYFGVPTRLQHAVLFFGILGALIFRAIFIGLGSLLLRFEWVSSVFGTFLVYTGFKMMVAEDKESTREQRDDQQFRRWCR
jgi:tellurite resistance protein TerC